MAPSWEATYPPDYDFYLNVTDGDGNDLLDRSKPFSIRDALNVAELDCGFTENGGKDVRELRTSIPIDIPLVRNVTTGEAVLVSYPVGGLAPQHDGFYNLTFTSLYDPGTIDLPGNLTLSHGSPTTVTSQGGDRCTIANPEQFENKFNNAYTRYVTFWYNGTASDSC